MSKNYIGNPLSPCGDFWCRGGTVMVSDGNGGDTWDICTSCIALAKKAAEYVHPDYPF